MIGNKIRLLEASEIECRVGSIGKNGLSLLLYKDARVDQKILDECFSPCGWKRTHQVIYALSDFLIMILSWLVKQSLRAFLFQEVQL